MSTLSFIIVMDVPVENVRDGSFMELFYAGDLILWWESGRDKLVFCLAGIRQK